MVYFLIRGGVIRKCPLNDYTMDGSSVKEPDIYIYIS